MKKLISMLMLFSMLMLCLFGTAAAEGTWKPDRNVEYQILSGAGSGTDVCARAMTAVIDELKLVPQPVVITYGNDGGGMVGISKTATTTSEPVANVLFTQWTSGSVLTMCRNSDLRMKDFRPIAVMCVDTGFFIRLTDSKYASFAAAIEAARNGEHVVVGCGKDEYPIMMQSMLDALGLNDTQISYIVYDSQSENVAALLGKHVDFSCVTASVALEYIHSGDCVAEFTTGQEHLPGELSELPTWKEYTDGAYADITPVYIWRGINAPKAMSDAAYDYWCGVFRQIADSDGWKEYCDKYLVANMGIVGQEAVDFMLTSEASILASLGK